MNEDIHSQEHFAKDESKGKRISSCDYRINNPTAFMIGSVANL